MHTYVSLSKRIKHPRRLSEIHLLLLHGWDVYRCIRLCMGRCGGWLMGVNHLGGGTGELCWYTPRAIKGGHSHRLECERRHWTMNLYNLVPIPHTSYTILHCYIHTCIHTTRKLLTTGTYTPSCMFIPLWLPRLFHVGV